MADFLALGSSSISKVFDSVRASLGGTASNAQAHPDAEYEIVSQSEQPTPAAQEGSTEMGFQDQFQREGRDGDALAQIAALGSVATFLVTAWVSTFASGTSFKWFGWHPLFQSLSLALFTYGILTLQPTSSPKTKAAGLTRHQLAMIILGFPIIFLGSLAIFYNKVASNRAHFTTWHGTFGLITFLFLMVQVALGGGSVWFNGRLFGGNPKAKSVWKYHRAIGYTTYLLLLLTFHLGGAWSHWSTENTSWIFRFLAYTLAPAVLLVAVYSRIRPSKMNFL